MASLSLHRVLGAWWVDGYPLRLVRGVDGWRVAAQPGEVKVDQWLCGCRLRGQRFLTRRDALQALLDALELPGAPSRYPDPACRRLAPGLYGLAGGLRASRSTEGWTILTSDARQVGSATSLWRAAWIAQVRFDDSTPRLAVVRGH